jgi:hypothetical protein
MMKNTAALLFASLMLLTTGCGTLLTRPVFPLRTGAQGVVLDQYDQPVPNAEMRAHGQARSAQWFLFGWFGCGLYEYSFRADRLGKWKFHRMDADDMWIEAGPPVGYDWGCDGQTSFGTEGYIYYGKYRTNVVLRLRKIEPPEQGE